MKFVSFHLSSTMKQLVFKESQEEPLGYFFTSHRRASLYTVAFLVSLCSSRSVNVLGKILHSFLTCGPEVHVWLD